MSSRNSNWGSYLGSNQSNQTNNGQQSQYSRRSLSRLRYREPTENLLFPFQNPIATVNLSDPRYAVHNVGHGESSSHQSGTSGYDISRIVDVKPQDLEEFTCGICLNVLKNPMVVQCCRQTYCQLCIEQWLSSSNTCPNDRQRLTIGGLTPAPRILFNLLNKMKIKCERHSDGCPVVTTIGNEEEHRKSCKYYACPKCGFKGEALEHDCVSYLFKVIEGLQRENNGKRQTFDHDDVAKTSHMVIESARTNMDKFDYKTRSAWIKSNWLGDFIRICKQAISNESDFESISRTISLEINKKLNTGRIWHVVSFTTNGGSSSVCPENFISFNCGRLFIEIFEGSVKRP